MQKTYLFSYEIGGSVDSWPVSVSISRNSRTKVWTLYFSYEDPEARQYILGKAAGPSDLIGLLEEHFCYDIGEFCDSLENDGDEELEQLAREVRDFDT